MIKKLFSMLRGDSPWEDSLKRMNAQSAEMKKTAATLDSCKARVRERITSLKAMPPNEQQQQASAK